MILRLYEYLLFVVVTLTVLEPAIASEPCVTDTQSGKIVVLVRPTNDALGEILGGYRSGSDSLESWVQRLDRHDQDLLPKNAFQWVNDRAQVIQLINDGTQDLPKLTPLRERTMLFVIRLQIRMLEHRVGPESPELCRVIHRNRKFRSVLDPKRDRIFGDVRDVYVASFYRALQDLDRAFQILGNPADPKLELPVGLNDADRLEAFFRARIRTMLEHAPG